MAAVNATAMTLVTGSGRVIVRSSVSAAEVTMALSAAGFSTLPTSASTLSHTVSSANESAINVRSLRENVRPVPPTRGKQSSPSGQMRAYKDSGELPEPESASPLDDASRVLDRTHPR